MHKKVRFINFILIIMVVLTACATPKTLPELPTASIARHSRAVDYSWINPQPSSVPTFDPNSTDPFLYDFRSSNLANLDFTNFFNILDRADFDSNTTWPPSEKLPASFSPDKVMELGKDPGLGIRALHEEGITGKGIGIAIIDQTPLVDHEEYVNQIQVFEDGNGMAGTLFGTSMHGPAVASIAVGKTVGVAPDADLYFIAEGDCNKSFETTKKTDFTCLAKDVLRVIGINQSLPEGRKIRVLSMSIGWGPKNTGYAEITEAVEKAKEAGIFVVSSSISETYGFNFQGMGREATSDPNDFSSYFPGSWWADLYYSDEIKLDQTLLIPMDARTTASPTGLDDYVHYGQGGWSWSIPYIAGMYALACQVNPKITPDKFWAAALKTGKTIQIEHEGKQYPFGVILDPKALLKEIK